MPQDATLTTTMNSMMGGGKTFLDKDGNDICRRVNLENFKAIYGHGLNVKWVKLLFLLLKKQVPHFIDRINSQAKS